ncbi:hypothetical protein IGS68_14480 [Skermanella sp. TT6]|uniref:Uncharacterized protein n=1 Tax=Skermanella cutis TaxID=2775420 RepID=A0ABX7B0Z0_9PROT|nr:hypothetical protein [Skermanella sp. TT6]QQP87329.1 hypothetical protein IGS68_14480 [Skermanella sp. TT6]
MARAAPVPSPAAQRLSAADTRRQATMLKFLGGAIGIIFLIGLLVLIGLLALIF